MYTKYRVTNCEIPTGYNKMEKRYFIELFEDDDKNNYEPYDWFNTANYKEVQRRALFLETVHGMREIQ